MSTSVLVTTSWLRRALGVASSRARSLRMLDASFKPNGDAYTDVYKKGHIPGAAFFDLHKCVHGESWLPRNLPEPLCLETYLRTLGICQDTHVVAYDQTDMRHAARAWWLLRAYGHKRVSILDGGFNKWQADGSEVTTDEPVFQKSNYRVHLNRRLLRSFDDMMTIIEDVDHEEQICDARDAKRFSGDVDDPDPATLDMRHGHMPGACNIPFTELIRKVDGYYLFRSPEEITRTFLQQGVDINRPVVATCQTGIMACSIAVAAEMIGMKDCPVHYGAWLEWSKKVKDVSLIEEGKQLQWFKPCSDPNCRYCSLLQKQDISGVQGVQGA